jgi:hypothetical protein
MTLADQRKALAEMAAWNDRYPNGTAVQVLLDSGEVRLTKTRSAASMLASRAVIWLEGVAGCYGLDRCTPVVGEQGGA